MTLAPPWCLDCRPGNVRSIKIRNSSHGDCLVINATNNMFKYKHTHCLTHTHTQLIFKGYSLNLVQKSSILIDQMPKTFSLDPPFLVEPPLRKFDEKPILKLGTLKKRK